MTEPFDLDARIAVLAGLIADDLEHWEKRDWHWFEGPANEDNEVLAYKAMNERWRQAYKKLLSDTIQAVKPGRQTKSPGKYLQHHIGYASCLDELEANITNLLGDK